MRINAGDLSDSRVIDLLQYHLNMARGHTPPGSAHALDLKGLQSPDITFWTVWDGETLIAMGALKQLSPDHGELKSMHTVPSARRKGVGRALYWSILSRRHDRVELVA
jgi:putative acetyltransferase